MKLNDLRAKRRRNEELQDELLLNQKKLEYQQNETIQIFTQNRRLKAEVIDYFSEEPIHYVFQDGLEELFRNERRFVENSEEIKRFFMKEKRRLSEENDVLLEKELAQLREEEVHGEDESGRGSDTNKRY